MLTEGERNRFYALQRREWGKAERAEKEIRLKQCGHCIRGLDGAKEREASREGELKTTEEIIAHLEKLKAEALKDSCDGRFHFGYKQMRQTESEIVTRLLEWIREE